MIRPTMVLFVLWASWVGVAAAQQSTSNPSDSTRPYHEIAAELREALRREATAKSPDERALAIQDLASLFSELRQDPRLESSPTLQGYKNQLWSRLTRVKDDLQREQNRNSRSNEQLLAARMEDSLAGTLALSGLTLGGPSRLIYSDAEGWGGGAIRDEGQALVELIQRTIQPEFWDVNGGPGTIVYYPPLKVLVVRATSEVHHQIGGGVRALRRD